MDLSTSPQGQQLQQRIKDFVHQLIIPLEKDLLLADTPDRLTPNWQNWVLDPRIEALKEKAKGEGMWNLFLPDLGLSNRDYAPIAEITGHSLLAPEVFNCNAPDTGNMEVLWKYGSDEQKEQWLKPLLEGKIRSAFCMTEPAVASSDATNMKATIEDKGDKIVLNGTKWWSTGIGHPNCKVVIFMGLSNPEAPRRQQHSMVLVPLDTPGVKIKRMLPVFGAYDPPYGHGEITFNKVELPKNALIAGAGRGL